MIKFCKDCRHYREMAIGFSLFEDCLRNVIKEVDLISGDPRPKGVLRARDERYCLEIEGCSNRYCGKEAKFFEPKPAWPN